MLNLNAFFFTCSLHFSFVCFMLFLSTTVVIVVVVLVMFLPTYFLQVVYIGSRGEH